MSFYYPEFTYYSVQGLISDASHVTTGDNPAYTLEDFFLYENQFRGKISDFVLTQFIAMANAAVLQSRWHENWVLGMGNFVAHFATIYLRAQGGDNPTASQIVAAATAKGLQTSKSVGSVSVSYDFSGINDDLRGWANWRETEFGKMFIMLAKPLGLGGMYIY